MSVYTAKNLREDDPKPAIAKCCHALLSSDKVDVNYIATSIFLRIHPLFKAGNQYSVYIIVLQPFCNYFMIVC